MNDNSLFNQVQSSVSSLALGAEGASHNRLNFLRCSSHPDSPLYLVYTVKEHHVELESQNITFYTVNNDDGPLLVSHRP